MFSTTYELSLTRNYVSRWAMPHAVRELIQNALDSESPFVYSFTQDEGAETFALSLTSEFTTLSPQTLLLGATSKADRAEAIGSFGEGYKIALLVLTRLGHDVEMRNGNKLWRPRFKHSPKFGEELLVIDETALPDKRNKGLTFVVHGLTAENVETIRSGCLQMQFMVGEIIKTPKGDILLDRPGKLYVGGLYVCDTGLQHSYNVRPEYLKLERDRQTVDSFELLYMTREMWFASGQTARVGEMIAKGVKDVEYATYNSPELIKDACYKAFRAQHGNGAVAVKSQEELLKFVKEGMTVEKVIIVNAAMHANVTASTLYRQEVMPKLKTPEQWLAEWFEEHKFNMHERCRGPFRDLLEKSKEWRAA